MKNDNKFKEDSCEYFSGVPLGGLGTGSVELRADGRFHEWQIFNNWGNSQTLGLDKRFPPFDLPRSFTALSCQQGNTTYLRTLSTSSFYDLSPVSKIEYKGEFPFVNLDYKDKIPLRVSCEAFSSFIPHNLKDSGQPSFALIFNLENISSKNCKASILVSIENPFGNDQSISQDKSLTILEIREEKKKEDYCPYYPGISLSALDGKVSYFSPGAKGHRQFLKKSLVNLRAKGMAQNPKKSTSGCLCSTIELKPKEKKDLRFVVSWFFPDHFENGVGHRVGHMYENWYKSSQEANRYFVKNFDRLYNKTKEWHDTLYSGNLPFWFKDLIANSLHLFAKDTWWTKDGRFGMYESFQCPDMDPLHVRDLASSAVCLLFPELDKQVLLRYASLQRKNGRLSEMFMTSTKDIPDVTDMDTTVTHPDWRRKIVDVEPKFILQTFRDYLWTGDKNFLKEIYPSVKNALYYSKTWDRDNDGLPDGIYGGSSTWDLQDMGYLPTFSSCLYLAALAAATEMAKIMNDTEFTEECERDFAKGRVMIEKKLWNGKYYVLNCDAKGQSNNICFADSLYGQAWAYLLGLGRLLSGEHIKKNISSVISLNGKDAKYGLTNGVYPDGSRAVSHDERSLQVMWPAVAFAVSMLCLYEDFVDEGISLLKNIYDNYTQNIKYTLWNIPDASDPDTGLHYINRVKAPGPWWASYFGHYLRNMSVFSTLLAIEGFHYDAAEKYLAFVPKLNQDDFSGPFITPACWGTISQSTRGKTQIFKLEIKDGNLEIKRLTLSPFVVKKRYTVKVNFHGKEVTAHLDKGERVSVEFRSPLKIDVSSSLEIVLR